MSMLRNAEHCDILETGAHPLVPIKKEKKKNTEITSLVCHSIGTVPIHNMTLKSCFNQNSPTIFKAISISGQILSTHGTLPTRGFSLPLESLPETWTSLHTLSLPHRTVLLYSLCFLSFLKLVKPGWVYLICPAISFTI